MKKTVLLFVLPTIIICVAGCDKDDPVGTNPVNSVKGVFVLYEGVFGQPSTYDYGYIDQLTGNVQANVYQNSNGGANLNSFPDGMLMNNNNREILITAQGPYAGLGTIYKINSTTNQVISTKSFGKNPYSIAVGTSGKILASNTAGDYVSVLDQELNVTDSVSVGLNPSDIIYNSGKFYCVKQSYTTENSLAVIDEITLNIQKVFFPNPPISVAAKDGKVFVSTYGSKMLYLVDQSSNNIVDSSSIPTTFVGISELASGVGNTIYIVGIDTAFFYSLGKEIWKFDIVIKTAVKIISSTSSRTNIYGINFDANSGYLYIADALDGIVNGELRVYDQNGSLVKTYANIGGKYPKRIVFKY